MRYVDSYYGVPYLVLTPKQSNNGNEASLIFLFPKKKGGYTLSKVKSRMDYARELQDEIKGVVMYSYERLQSLRDINIRLHQTGEVWFEDSFEGHRDELKFKEKEEKAAKLYKELDSFTKQTKYNEIYRDFLVEIKDEEDEKKWLGIYNRHRDDIRDLRIDMNSKYQKFLADMTELFKIVTTQKRKEREFKMKETPIEEFVRNADQIRKVLYEKCNAGIITLEQREASLGKLNAYIESANRFSSEVSGAVEAYCEGTMTCEELDNIVSGYYKENPEQAMFYEGLHIDNRFRAMRNEIVGLRDAGVLALEDAKDALGYLNNLYDMQMFEHANYLESGEVPGLELTVNSAMDHYFGAIKAFNESASEGETDLGERVNALNAFNEETWNYMESAEDTTIAAVVIGAYLACIAAVISIPIGRAINSKKGSKLIKAYETLHPEAVKFSSLTISKMSIEKTGAKYIPEIKKLVDGNLNTSGKCFLAKHNGKAFAVIASIFASSNAAVITSDGVGSATSVSNTRFYFKALTPEAVAHKEFYEAALMLKKFKVSTPEIKEFCKEMKNDFEDLRKEQEKAEKEQKAAEKKAKSVAEARVAKEAAGYEYDNDKVYQYVREQLMQKYIDGEITLEQREGALVEARDRLFGNDADLINEGVFDKFVKKVTTKKSETCNKSEFQKAKASYAANNAEINRLNTKIKSLEKMEAQKSDPTTLKKCADEIKRLQAKVKKLVSDNAKISKSMQTCMMGESVNDKIYENISEQVTDKYIGGEITYEERESLLEATRDRVIVENADLIEEGVLQKISDKIQDQKISGSVEQLRAKYLSNMQEVKRTEKRINELKQVLNRRDIDPIVAKKTAREINQLQAKAKKLESDANFAYKKMSAQDFKNAPREKFNNTLAKTKPVTQ